MTLLYDVKEGEEFGIYVLIKGADLRTARNGNPFIAFRFQDRSGSMDGMYWSATEEEIATFQVGKVAFLRGERDNYQGTPQVKIKALRLAEAGEPNDPTLYVERIEMKIEDIQEEINDALFEIHEPNIARIVRKILSQNEEKFFSYPAAKRHHHAMAGGLSYHTVSMLKIARAMIEIYPQLNPSLLIGGLLLHDIGKTIELSGPISTEYTFKGKMLGHIVIISEMIDQACREIGIDNEQESVILLKHVVLAHHGKLEYGSPVMPKLLEAEILHQIDNMDANINMIASVLEKTEPGQESAQIFPLDRRAFYKPTFK
ncbi:HD domain-containing protein [Facklamia sp. DSM 111018]|uniref:HD domain-containing protein n=1 Tax=Facklamia lactis TaxID=2749967 RepID=A0ABS0LPC8_9LACT|nr:HD domain-containing protein [Facklamia lactis]MBG9980205.1 HD domain-containing protein [Facklamia lactis]MBG9986008.1 HD domain-containing protein [Facklamia lactis]